MSDTAQTALTVVCYLVALVAELAGIALLVAQARATGRALRRARGPVGTEGASAPRPHVDDVVDQLLRSSFDRMAGVVLLVVGLLLSTVGNLLAL